MDDIQRMRLDMDHWGIVLQKRLKKFQRAQPTHWVLEEAKSGLTKKKRSWQSVPLLHCHNNSQQTQDFCGQPVHKNPSVGLSKINNTKCMKVVRAEIVFARECRMCALCWIIKTSQYLLWFMGDAKRGSSQCDLRYFPFTKANADIHKLK